MLVSLVAILSIAAAATTAITSTPVGADVGLPANNNPSGTFVNPFSSRGEDVHGTMSNAKRLASGFPLKPPRRRAPPPVVPKKPPHAKPSNKYKPGYISCYDVDTDDLIGYISTVLNKFGEFQLTPLRPSALLVDVPSSGTGLIQSRNGPDARYEYVGATIGSESTDSNLARGSYNYAYLTPTIETAPNAIPRPGDNAFTAATGISRETESRIWSYDPVSRIITPHWVNSDQSNPKMFMAYSQDILILTADKMAYSSKFGPAQYFYMKLETAKAL